MARGAAKWTLFPFSLKIQQGVINSINKRDYSHFRHYRAIARLALPVSLANISETLGFLIDSGMLRRFGADLDRCYRNFRKREAIYVAHCSCPELGDSSGDRPGRQSCTQAGWLSSCFASVSCSSGVLALLIISAPLQ